MSSITPTQEAAIKNFLESWGLSQPYFEIGVRLNCGEADALAEFLRAFDREKDANQLLDGHSIDDDNDDNPEHVRRRDEYFDRLKAADAVFQSPKKPSRLP